MQGYKLEGGIPETIRREMEQLRLRALIRKGRRSACNAWNAIEKEKGVLFEMEEETEL